MEVKDIIDGIVDMLEMSEMCIEVTENIMIASLDNDKFKITVEKI